jgi:Kef-type K+ transport system membrane component KefB/nucleotide-binding universal stress UspA family protein
MIRKVLLYFFLIGGTLIFLWLILKQGTKQELEKLHQIEQFTGRAIHNIPEKSIDFFKALTLEFSENSQHWISRLILQLLVIIFISRLFSHLARKAGQPGVVGEIIAGIVLGPSVLGYFIPEYSAFLFPQESLHNLSVLSTLGLILFMFIIGMEVDIKILSNRAQDAVVISHSAITIQFFLGTILAYFLYAHYAPSDVAFVPFALFIGISLSVTAFPVLARIIQERGLTKSYLGTMAITTAAVDDVTAWCLLAIVIAIVKSGTAINAIFTISLALVFIIFMLLVVRPFLKRVGNIFDTTENLTRSVVALIFFVLLISCLMSELIGIHVLFGAFLAGVIMPQHFQFKQVLTQKIEDVSIVLLLPLFFVTTGLRTEIGLLNSPALWGTCLLIIAIATFGKMGAVTAISKFIGLTWKNALSLGALMNTKGLMELVVLNIAFDLGILSKEIFTMLVIMALATTFFTVPLLNLIQYAFSKRMESKPIFKSDRHKILISFGPAKMGKTLVGLAKFFSSEKSPSHVSALHITPQSDISPQEAVMYERSSFAPAKKKAEELRLPIETHYKVTQDVTGEINRLIHKKNIDLLIVGGAKPLFGEKVLGGKLKTIIENASCDVAVLSDKNFNTLRNLLIIVNPTEEKYILDYGFMLARNAKASVTIINSNLENKQTAYFINAVDNLQNIDNIEVTILENRKLEEDFLEKFDLIVVSDHYWNQVIENLKPELRNNFSYLIIHKHQNK